MVYTHLGILLICLVACQGIVRADTPLRVGYVALGAVSFADIELSGRALERGFVEANPIYRPFAKTPGMLGLVNGAVSTSIGLGAYALHKQGKRKTARTIIWGWTALRAAVVLHNIRVLAK